MSAFSSGEEMSKDQFIKAIVKELQSVEDMNLPRKQTTKIDIQDAYEYFGYDWPEVDSRAFAAVHECLSFTSNSSKSLNSEIYPWKTIPLTPKFVDGIMSAKIIDDSKEAQVLKAEVLGKMFFFHTTKNKE